MAYTVSFDGPILMIRFHGTVTPADLDGIGTELLAIEQNGTVTPPRMSDLRPITEMAIGYADIARLADRARARPLDTHVRSALVVTQPVQLGYARMFQILNEHPRVTVRIFEDDAPARDWLLAAHD